MMIMHKDLVKKFQSLGLVDAMGNPIHYNAFKNRATIVRYIGGHSNTPQKILFLGLQKKNLWAIYLNNMSDADYMKEAYDVFVDSVAGNMGHVMNDVMQWGACAIPDTYSRISKIELA